MDGAQVGAGAGAERLSCSIDRRPSSWGLPTCHATPVESHQSPTGLTQRRTDACARRFTTYHRRPDPPTCGTALFVPRMVRDDPNPEIPLEGGHMNPVVRVGDTVRRRLGPWSPGVHALLRHLRESGFTAAPEVVGIDPQGREILRFIGGDIGLHADPRLLWTDRMLVATGRMLRSFHDAQRGFEVPKDIPWNPIGREPQGIPEVICHND